MPSTLLALVVFLASIGPGYAHVRVLERRGPRIPQTQLAELAELASIGAACTFTAATFVLLVGDAVGAIDPGKVLADTQAYTGAEPARVMVFVLLSLAVSYGAAVLIAYKLRPPTLDPELGTYDENASAWVQRLLQFRPKEAVVLALLELQDGRRMLGVVGGFTPGSPGSRELTLVAPIAVQKTLQHPLERWPMNFAIVGEREIATFMGHYSGKGSPTAMLESS